MGEACEDLHFAGLRSSKTHGKANIFTMKMLLQVRVGAGKLCKYFSLAKRLVLQCVLLAISGCLHRKALPNVPPEGEPAGAQDGCPAAVLTHKVVSTTQDS